MVLKGIPLPECGRRERAVEGELQVFARYSFHTLVFRNVQNFRLHMILGVEGVGTVRGGKEQN